MDTVLNHYYEAGQPLAHILEVEYQKNNQLLMIKVDEGLINDINITGNIRTKTAMPNLGVGAFQNQNSNDNRIKHTATQYRMSVTLRLKDLFFNPQTQ